MKALPLPRGESSVQTLVGSIVSFSLLLAAAAAPPEDDKLHVVAAV